MKVIVVKGPNFAETEKRVHELLYRIISKSVKEENSNQKGA